MFFHPLTKDNKQQQQFDAAIAKLASHLNDMKKDIKGLRKAGEKQKIPSDQVDALIEYMLIQFRRQLTADIPDIDVMIGPIMRYLRQ